MKLDIKNKILVVLLFFLTCGSLNAFAQRKAAVGGQFSAWHNGKENSSLRILGTRCHHDGI